MELHEIIEIHHTPYFREMRVESGFMYNFWDAEKNDYDQQWIFVPDSTLEMPSEEEIQEAVKGFFLKYPYGGRSLAFVEGMKYWVNSHNSPKRKK